MLGITSSGALHFLSPVFAEGTPAGTDIINRATATYSDGTTTFDAISNTVTVEVEEVRGLIVTDAGFADGNGGSIATNDSITFDFLVTNTGNADAYIFIPGATALDGLVVGGDITGVEIVQANGVAIGPISVPAAGASTSTLTGLANGGAIAADGSLTVRVTMSVTATTAGDPVSVQFGDTSEGGAPQNQQNIRDDADGDTGAANDNDVYTLDADGALSPANGEREAAAFHEEFLSTAPRPLAQTTILLTSTLGTGTDANSAVDDTVTYDLDFRVENNPQTGFPAGDLEGTTINLDTGAGPQIEERILVATTVPPNTVWDGTTPTVPNGDWTVVYSTDDPTVGTDNPLSVTWTTTPPADPTTVKRIGFVYDASVDGSLPPNTTVNNFGFTVVTSGLPSTGGTVANIGQIFGETDGDPDNNLVYDESGDQDPNNYDDGVFPPNPEVSDFDPNTDTGVANPADPDPTGTNQGVGPDGEANVVTITALPPTNSALLNGPNNVPNATGPTNDNDDFTNVSTSVDVVGLVGDPSNPAAVTITNTVGNNVATNLDTVTLLPIAPEAATALTGGIYGEDYNNNGSLNDDLPDGTLVTISFGAQSATYEYDNGTGTFTLLSANDVVVGRLNPSQTQSYTVTIDLPAGTPQIQGYAVPILAFVDNNGNGDFDAASETVYNITIDRVYPGFIALVKAVRILDASGTQVDPANPVPGFTDTPTVRPQPGYFIEYQVSYLNVSEVQPATGGGNVILTGSALTIDEDGATLPNTWAGVTTHQQNTVATLGTLQFFNGAVGLGTADPATGTAVTRYVNTINTLAPQVGGSLRFRRVVD